MKKIISLFIPCLLLIKTFAQYDPSKINKKAIAVYNEAMENIRDGKFSQAEKLLLQSIKTDKKYVDAYLSLGGVYGQQKNYSSSVAYYEKAFVLDSNYTLDYKLPYSINLAGMGEFQKALDAVNEILTKKAPKNENALKALQYRKRCYEFAVTYAKEHPSNNYVFTPKNLGDSVNTEASEYWPSLTVDGKELVFTRRIGHTNEDFYSSIKTKDGWDKAQKLKGAINTPQNEAAQSISLDGEWLVFTADNRRDGWGSFDLYISFLTPQGWTEAQNLGPVVNSDQWDSQPSLSPDKKALYFASRRIGGYGGSDIYVSYLQPDGTWGKPENLGPSINTSGNEQCPFIHADNQTLYFTSDYWQGYGDDDIFFSKKGPNNSWSKPVNLGYPINTIDREGTLYITPDGKTAYYASDRSDSRGGLDIYSFELREDVRPNKTLWVRGQVTDKKTLKGVLSNIELIDLTTKRPVSSVETNEEGYYVITLPVGRDYAFNVNRKGYLFYSDNYLLSKEAPDSTYEKNIVLQPIEVDASVTLNNIFFDVNKFDLKSESEIELDKIVELLKQNPGLKIEISGHTDNVGTPADNLTLSNNRAKAVVNYLISKGIAAQRLTFKGYGETQPVADNDTEEGRSKNRRTEMKVTGQ
jgi:outer membrane protein OmpA-like peptidoglycan-associated protein/tetratricopeptide (TPR) repeat protein